jgi:ubiquitin-conjugating enzyme E2 Q
LLITGFHNAYPVLSNDALPLHVAKITFQVGLTGAYKPEKVAAKDAARTFTLVVKNARTSEPEVDPFEPLDDDAGLDDADAAGRDREEEEEPEPEPGAFRRFALSAVLEKLMDDVFLSALQLRVQFGLGWAGAEALLSATQRTQQRPEELFEQMRVVRQLHI